MINPPASRHAANVSKPGGRSKTGEKYASYHAPGCVGCTMTAPAILHRPARAEACIAQIWALEEAPNLRPLICLLAADA
jgi:hypothetical protein